MLKTDIVIKLLKKEKRNMSFEEIWNEIKDETISSIKKELSESQVKADMYMSMMEDQSLIMVGDNSWNLKNSFSYDEIKDIKKARITDDVEIIEEETDDTIELKLGVSQIEEE